MITFLKTFYSEMKGSKKKKRPIKKESPKGPNTRLLSHYQYSKRPNKQTKN